MRDTLRHRGPDAEGTWSDTEAGIALGHRRLSIVELSSAGAQPMVSANGRWVITYNGEIYNFRSLRGELDQAGGHSWRGGSDTEVLIEAVAAWGPERALERIEGQFAFALWDRAERRLTLARDRFGEKPLYYGRVGTDLVFASELKAIRRHPQFRGELDRGAVASYLRYGYIPHPRSIYRGIHKLPQACWVAFRPGAVAAGDPVPTPYWSRSEVAREAAAAPFRGSEDDAVSELDGRMRAAVADRMVADVPLGALLSGGIDSSLTVALMQAQSGRPVKTFTIGSWDHGLNEAAQAQEIARRLGTEHTELFVGAAQALEVIPNLASIYDEPFADSSQVPTFLVSRLARSSVTVALSGDGGDELFGGYNRYFLGPRWRQFARLPGPLRLGFTAAAQAISPGAWSTVVGHLGRLAPRELRYGRAGDKVHKWADKASSADEREFLARLLAAWPEPGEVLADAAPAADVTDGLSFEGPGDFAREAMACDTDYFLPDDILMKVDRASMANSLEVRSAYLDSGVFAFAWSLPMAMKIGSGAGKRVLRRLLGRYVPAAVFDRPKQGFAVPIADWLRNELRDWGESLLAESRLRSDGLFKVAEVRHAWSEHLSGRRNWDMRLWTVLMMQMWLDENKPDQSDLPLQTEAVVAPAI
jgi:asparagine synthase (glutamine-hydrolysing)